MTVGGWRARHGLAPQDVSPVNPGTACSHPVLDSISVDGLGQLPRSTNIDIWNFSFELHCEIGRLKPVNLQCDIRDGLFRDLCW